MTNVGARDQVMIGEARVIGGVRVLEFLIDVAEGEGTFRSRDAIDELVSDADYERTKRGRYLGLGCDQAEYGETKFYGDLNRLMAEKILERVSLGNYRVTPEGIVAIEEARREYT